MPQPDPPAPPPGGFFMACVQTPAGIAQGRLVWTDGVRGAVRVGAEVIEGRLIERRRRDEPTDD